MWQIIRTGNKFIHVVPVDDLIDHSTIILKEKDGRDVIITSNCPCQPGFEFGNENTIIIHKSYDLREAVEQIHDLLNQ